MKSIKRQGSAVLSSETFLLLLYQVVLFTVQGQSFGYDTFHEITHVTGNLVVGNWNIRSRIFCLVF